MRYPKLVNIVKESLDEHKAENIVVEDVKALTPFSDYYIIATAPNERAVGALADYLVEDLAKAKQDDPKISGTPSSGWVIVDDGDVVAHIFTEEERNEIDLTGLVQEHLKKRKK